MEREEGNKNGRKKKENKKIVKKRRLEETGGSRGKDKYVKERWRLGGTGKNGQGNNL